MTAAPIPRVISFCLFVLEKLFISILAVKVFLKKIKHTNLY